MQRHGAAVRWAPVCLAFAEHVNGFVTGEGSPSRPKRAEVLAGLDAPFDGPVVLFHQVVEVTADPMPAVFRQVTLAFQLRDGGRVSGVPIGVDHPGLGVVLPAQGFGQKAFCCLGVLFWPRGENRGWRR